MVDAYNLVFASLVLVAGSLSDRLGRKGMLLAGLGVFGAASLAGFLHHRPPADRGQGSDGARRRDDVPGHLVAADQRLRPARRERAAAIGLWGATTGVGIATGPIIGGWLLEHYWWGSVFLFTAPVAAGVAALAAWAATRPHGTRAPRRPTGGA